MVPQELPADAATLLTALVLRTKGEVHLTEQELRDAAQARLSWRRDIAGGQRQLTFTAWRT